MRFDAIADVWYLQTDFPLPDHALKSACRFVRKIQADRLRSTPEGDRRTLIAQSLAALDARKVKQELINGRTRTSRGDLTLLEAKR